MKDFFFIACLGITVFISSCGNKTQEKTEVYNAKLGIGKYKTIELGDTVNNTLAKKGDDLYMKHCATCHKLSTDLLVGPGWEMITKRRDPVWLMNLMTNLNEMLDSDPSLKEQQGIYKMRMPDFELSDHEARAILEFMRKNDTGKIDKNRDLPAACMHTGR